jgi:ABC-2 type transport system ATP-binding protein
MQNHRTQWRVARVIALESISKKFGPAFALSEVSLHIPNGQMWGLLGPNGAGKTTLFRILMGILKASSGSATVAGLDVFDASLQVKRVLGFLPDEPMFHSYMTGREIFDLTSSLHGIGPQISYTRMQSLIVRLQMREALGKFADDYSRGMKKKLGLLLALLHQPKLLILDEPTNGLDVESTALFYALMREQQCVGTTVVFSTHLLAQVEALCSHVAIIHHGKIVAQGPLTEVAHAAPKPFGAAEDYQATLEQAFLAYTKSPVTAALPGHLLGRS